MMQCKMINETQKSGIQDRLKSVVPYLMVNWSTLQDKLTAAEDCLTALTLIPFVQLPLKCATRLSASESLAR